MNKHTVAWLIGIAGCCLFSAARPEQSTVARIVKFRQATMTVQAETFASLTAMVTGKVPYDAKRAQLLADRTVLLAQITSETFPESSRNAPGSNTLPEVWSDRQGFARMMTEYLENTAAVASASRSGTADSLRPAVVAVGKVCRSCHQGYESLP